MIGFVAEVAVEVIVPLLVKVEALTFMVKAKFVDTVTLVLTLVVALVDVVVTVPP